MDNIYKNKIHNYFFRYGIKETEENFKNLENVINKKDYLIYEQILDLIENCWIIKSDNCGLIIEIDYEENEQLLKDLTKIFFTRKLGQRRAKKKSGMDTKLGICLLN